MKLAAAAAALLVSIAIIGAPASAQTRFPRPQAEVAMVRTYLGCFIDPGRYLHLRNTTSAALRVGTPVYWTGKQSGQQAPREYRAPLYAEVAPGGTYQIGGVYRYDPTAGCRVWILRTPTATLAP